MSDAAGAAVVVGVDGSPQSLNAVVLAGQLASERQRPLHVVHAFMWPLMNVPLGPAPGAPAEGGLEYAAQQIVDEAVAQIRAERPRLTVTGEIIVGAAAAVLTEISAEAALLVVGDRGLGGFGSLLLGSVAVATSAHAQCPVVVVRGTPRDGDILVGVDGSPTGGEALEFAFDEAARRGVGVVAVHAYTHPVSTFPGDILLPVYDPDQLAAEENAVLHEAIVGYAERYPDVAVRPALVRQPAARALVEESAKAALTVVGSRGFGGFRGLLLGSVSQAVIHHAECPVAIVR
jgi:nucleotide-binding universal stress UspA family protein